MSIRNITIGILLLAGIAAFAIFFTQLNMHGENTICHNSSFSDWNDELGKCETKGNYASNIIIVAGNTSNTPKPQISDKSKKVYPYLKNSIANGADIKIISVASDLSVKAINNNQNKEIKDAEEYIESIEQTINQINEEISKKPRSDGATYMEAITKAGRDVVSAKEASTKESEKDDGAAIIVLGSGLSDNGILNFANNKLLTRDTQEIIDAMRKANQITSDLTGVKILWYGIGQTTSPQDQLSKPEIDKLEDIYREALQNRGATIDYDNEATSSETIEDNPYKVKPTPITKVDLPPREFDWSELKFKAYSSILEDESAALMTLSDVINDAKKYPSRELVITGYMAAGTCTGKPKPEDIDLPGKRAETVKKLLQKNGVTNQITVINGGVFEPEKPECSNGEWKSELADYRRKVRTEFI